MFEVTREGADHRPDSLRWKSLTGEHVIEAVPWPEIAMTLDETGTGSELKRHLLASLLVLIALILAGCGPAVPDVSGLKLAEAKAALAGAGFEAGKVTYDESAEGTRGAVVGQEPAAGKRAKKGDAVALTLAGPAPVAVPAVVGQGRDAAKTALEAAGLKVGEVTESYDASIPAGVVISHSPTAKEIAERDSAVALVVSKGPEPVAVPGLKGKTEADARKALTSAGFKVVVKTKADGAPKGTVIAQEPGGGKVAPGSTITLTVSSGVEMVRVPNVYNKWFENAESAIRAAGLKPVSMKIYGGEVGDVNLGALTSMWGYVYKQSPKAGALVPKGTKVRFYWAYESS